jgi:hypothetical protein
MIGSLARARQTELPVCILYAGVCRIWPGSASQLAPQPRRDTHVRLLASFIRECLNVNPAIEAVGGLRQTQVGPDFNNLPQICATALLIQDLHGHFLATTDLNTKERDQISWDAAKRVGFLALQAWRFDVRTALSLLSQALKLDYRLFAQAMVKKAVARVLQA